MAAISAVGTAVGSAVGVGSGVDGRRPASAWRWARASPSARGSRSPRGRARAPTRRAAGAASTTREGRGGTAATTAAVRGVRPRLRVVEGCGVRRDVTLVGLSRCSAWGARWLAAGSRWCATSAAPPATATEAEATASAFVGAPPPVPSRPVSQPPSSSDGPGSRPASWTWRWRSASRWARQPSHWRRWSRSSRGGRPGRSTASASSSRIVRAVGRARLGDLGEPAAGAHEQRLDGRDGGAERGRELLVGEALELADDQRGALLLGQRVEVGDQPPQVLAALDHGDRVGAAGQQLVRLQRRGGRAAHVVDAAVVGDAVEPRPHGDLAVAGAQGAVGAEEDVLHDVLGLGVPAQHVAHVGEQALVVAVVHHAERVLAAGAEEGEQLLVGPQAQQRRGEWSGGAGLRWPLRNGTRAREEGCVYCAHRVPRSDLLRVGVLSRHEARRSRSSRSLLLAAPAHAAGPEVGVADDRILFVGGADPDRTVAEWRANGVDVVRLFALWSRIEGKGGGYSWHTLDQAVQRVRGAGLKVMLTVSGPGPGGPRQARQAQVRRLRRRGREPLRRRRRPLHHLERAEPAVVAAAPGDVHAPRAARRSRRTSTAGSCAPPTRRSGPRTPARRS